MQPCGLRRFAGKHTMAFAGGLGMRVSVIPIAICAVALLAPMCAGAADLPPGPLSAPQTAAAYVPPAPSRHLECYAGVLGEGVDSHPTFYNVPSSGVDQDSFADGGRGGVVGGCDIVFASHTFLGMDTSAVYGQVKGSQLGFQYNTPFQWDTRVRVGYKLDEQWSVYAAGGAEDSYRTTTSPTGVVNNGTDWGGVVAVGWEWQFAQNWRMRGEYQFVWPGLSGISFPGSASAQWAPSENLIRLAIMRTFAF